MKRKRVRHWRKFGAAAVLCAAMLLCGPATSLAFKSETHVYISQQILNDVISDGKVTIEPFGEFIVDPAIVDALRNNPSAYRMGAVGPDAFPDIIGGQMAIHPGTADWPSDIWLKRILEAARDARQKAFAYGFLGHAAGDMFGHTYINTYAGGIFRLQENQEVVLRHITLEEYIKDRTPPIIDHTGSTIRPYDNNALDVPAEFLRNVLLLEPSAASQFSSTAPHLKKMYDFWSALNAAVSRVDRVKSEMNHGINKLINEINSLQAKIDSIKNKTVKICIPFLGCKTFKLYPAYCFLDPGTCLLLESTEATLALTKAHLDLAKSIQSATVDATAAPIIVWKKEVEEAIKQYIITSGEVARAIMDPAPNTDPQMKLRDWACRYAPVFTGVPNEAVLPGCAGIDFLTNINNKIESLRSAIREKLGFLSWLVDPFALVDDIQNEVKKVVTGELSRFGFDLAGELTGPASTTAKAVALLLQPVTVESLNETFSTDTSDIGLVKFENVATRADADMHLDASGYFDPAAFNAVYNSIVLSKLTLLGPSELNRLAHAAGGVSGTVYGTDLYSPSTPFNILFGAIRSLDGNQQWQEYGIPYPRSEGYNDPTPAAQRQYGYSYSGSSGFRLWQDCEVRDGIFRRIFHGPNAPGIEAPALLGLSDVLPAGDPNRTTLEAPFSLADGSHLPFKDTTPALLEILNPTTATDLVVKLNNSTCGGDQGTGTFSWSFGDMCNTNCTCTSKNIRYPVFSEGMLPCDCNGPICSSGAGDPQSFTITDMAQAGDLGTPLSCYVYRIRSYIFWKYYDYKCTFQKGTGKGTPVTTLVGYPNALEYNGNLICDATAKSTNLVKVQQPDLTVQSATAALAVQTTGAVPADFLTWSDVNAGILEASNNQENACSIVASSGVRPVPDTTPPTITAPDDITAECTAAGAGGQAVNLGTVSASDNMDFSWELHPVNDAPALFPPGTTEVAWSVSDSAGNASIDKQLITIVDTAPPSFVTGCQPVSAKATSNSGTPVDLTPPVFNDACSGQITAATETSFGSFPFGETVVTWTAKDGAGNVATCKQSVTVSAPVAGPQSVTTVEDVPHAITLTGSDPDNAPLTFVIKAAPGHGMLSGAPPHLIYTPASDYNGDDAFTFVVNNGTVDSAEAAVVITIIPVSAAIDAARNLQQVFASLNASVFRHGEKKNALINKLNAVIKQMRRGHYHEVLEQLRHDILRKMDGCAVNGEPDRKDWITTCQAQEQVYSRVMDLIRLFEGVKKHHEKAHPEPARPGAMSGTKGH